MVLIYQMMINCTFLMKNYVHLHHHQESQGYTVMHADMDTLHQDVQDVEAMNYQMTQVMIPLQVLTGTNFKNS